MSRRTFTRHLRPYLFTRFDRVQCPHSTRSLTSSLALYAEKKQNPVTHDYVERVAQLEARKPLSECYPRHQHEASPRQRLSREILNTLGQDLKPGETIVLNPSSTDRSCLLHGRVRSIRTAGSKLLFMDIVTEDASIQAVVQFSKLQTQDESLTPDQFKAFAKIARKGDIYQVLGHPYRTESGELSILATELPKLLSPSLHQIPESLRDPETRARNRHVDMLVNPEAIQTLQLRHHIEAEMQKYFNNRGFTKVVTPLLSAIAGGAVARPFETVATELSDETLQLRIAPELWLKRLVVGGMYKVYEIGPAFRNEGVDATHNPEFHICESYEAYATLQDLLRMTRELLTNLYSRIHHLRQYGQLHALEEPDFCLPQSTDAHGAKGWELVDSLFKKDAFIRAIEFVPTLEAQLGCKLPDLQAPNAHDAILALFADKQIAAPSKPTLARLLDALAVKYLEPISHTEPIFLTHYPACMSPFSKHFHCPITNQLVAARAELFIGGREYANMYEEENSPFEQRKKFEQQLVDREGGTEAMKLDEHYLRALEWGLPPTGGWGCGLDRLVMLFSGRQRIGDVLAFGTLRNVVGLGKI